MKSGLESSGFRFHIWMDVDRFGTSFKCSGECWKTDGFSRVNGKSGFYRILCDLHQLQLAAGAHMCNNFFNNIILVTVCFFAYDDMHRGL